MRNPSNRKWWQIEARLWLLLIVSVVCFLALNALGVHYGDALLMGAAWLGHTSLIAFVVYGNEVLE